MKRISFFVLFLLATTSTWATTNVEIPKELEVKCAGANHSACVKVVDLYFPDDYDQETVDTENTVTNLERMCNEGGYIQCMVLSNFLLQTKIAKYRTDEMFTAGADYMELACKNGIRIGCYGLANFLAKVYDFSKKENFAIASRAKDLLEYSCNSAEPQGCHYLADFYVKYKLDDLFVDGPKLAALTYSKSAKMFQKECDTGIVLEKYYACSTVGGAITNKLHLVGKNEISVEELDNAVTYYRKSLAYLEETDTRVQRIKKHIDDYLSIIKSRGTRGLPAGIRTMRDADCGRGWQCV